MKVLRLAIRLTVLVVVLSVAYVGWTGWQVWHYSRVDQAQKADAIVVMGAAQYNGTPSPVLAARLDHAVSLWKKGYAPLIVVTGGRADGDKYTEATASAQYMAEQGVPDVAVLREVQGRTSWESLQASARFLEDRGIKKVILVSDSFHNARIRAMAQDLGLKPLVSPTLSSPIHGASKIPYGLKEMASLGVGQIIGFDRLEALERRVNQ